MLEKIYLEITNICNLDCTFCHKTKREKKLITLDEFNILTDKLRDKAKFLYFHLMGEPTLHPNISTFIEIAKQKDFLPVITTNGSLLSEKGDQIISSLPHKISISLHAPEANPAFSDDNYLNTCINFAKRAAECGTIVALRLWNLGTDADNSLVLEKLHKEFTSEWTPVRRGNSQRLAHKIFIEWGERFDWPDLSEDECNEEADMFCYGLRDQIGVLVDGTVVPCCLDSDGILALGNLYKSDLNEILSSPLALSIYDGFTSRRATQELCRKCGFARRFSKNK